MIKTYPAYLGPWATLRCDGCGEERSVLDPWKYGPSFDIPGWIVVRKWERGHDGEHLCPKCAVTKEDAKLCPE